MDATVRPPLNAWTDEKFVFGTPSGAFHGYILVVHFEADAEFAVDERVTQSLAKSPLGCAFTAGFAFEEEIQSPMPAPRQLFAEQKLQFVGVGRVVVKLPFRVQSWIQRNPIPIG